MTPFSLPTVALILAANAALLCIWGAVRAHAAVVNAEVLSEVLIKLINAGNGSRMLKLCMAMTDEVPAGRGVRQMVLRAVGEPPHQDAHGYRDGGPQTLWEGAQGELREVYTEATRPALRGLRWSVALQAIGATAGVTAARLLAPTSQAPVAGALYPVALLVAAGATLWGFRARWLVRSGTALVLERTLGPMAKAWLDGSLKKDEPGPPTRGQGEKMQLAPDEILFEVVEGLKAPEPVIVKRGVIKIGKMDRCHVRLDHPSVARMHAVVEATRDEVVIIDLGHQAGTVVNGKAVAKARLHSGDIVRLGEVTMKITLPGG